MTGEINNIKINFKSDKLHYSGNSADCITDLY